MLSAIKISFIVVLITSTVTCEVTNCDVCTGKSCLRDSSCDYLSHLSPLIAKTGKMMCFTSTLYKEQSKGCIHEDLCRAREAQGMDIQCCDTNNCNSSPVDENHVDFDPLSPYYDDQPIPSEPLEDGRLLWCEICGKTSCYGAANCEIVLMQRDSPYYGPEYHIIPYDPIRYLQRGPIACFTNQTTKERGCVEERMCEPWGHYKCCFQDNCNGASTSMKSKLMAVVTVFVTIMILLC